MDPYKILAIIPAREGSKRVPGKNFRTFANTTLVDVSIGHALASALLTDIVVSSDSEKILAISQKYPEVIALKRPDEFSTDESPAIEYVIHAVKEMEAQKNYVYDIIVILQPSSPLRKTIDIDLTINLLIKNAAADSAVSVVKLEHMAHPAKLKVMRDNELLPYLEAEDNRFSASELPDVYVRNGAVYVTWRKQIETRANVIGEKSMGYVMPSYTSLDVNEKIDFEFAEYLYFRNNENS